MAEIYAVFSHDFNQCPWVGSTSGRYVGIASRYAIFWAPGSSETPESRA
ncbi:hypothetical protein J2S92_004165 [Arthrobacter bambusae]|jgi:hypothetical protein|nr:hypothetical protein [Arthrobacter bambusae]MDQ0237757.1 hypothetical protein [Arthrobacter bambusae]